MFTITFISFIALTLGALGNRCWGWEHGERSIGVFLMTAGIVMVNPELALWTPVIAGLVWLFRFRGTGDSWLAFQDGKNRTQALLRGAMILPLTVFLTLATGEWWHAAVGFCFPVIAYFYYYAGKERPANATLYAELLTGAYLVLVGV